jgi:uridylate kinase
VDGVYDADPNTTPDARRYVQLTYAEALAKDIRVMDASAFVLAGEQHVLMHVFDAAATGAMRAICEGQDIGTRIQAGE